MNPGGGSGRDEPPLDIQIPDDARELARDVLAYHRELRARRRRSRLRKLARPFAGQGALMPLLASILAVCLVAGAMLSVATFGPATPPAKSHSPGATASGSLRSNPQTSAPPSAPTVRTSGSTSGSAPAVSTSGRETARPSGSANSPARSSPSASQVRPTTVGGP